MMRYGAILSIRLTDVLLLGKPLFQARFYKKQKHLCLLQRRLLIGGS